MPKVITKTLIATLLWRKFLEHNKFSTTYEEIKEFHKNVLEYIKDNYNYEKYIFKIDKEYVKTLIIKEKLFYESNEIIYVNREYINWENELIFQKDYYNNTYSMLKEAYLNSPLPNFESGYLNIYDNEKYLEVSNDLNLKEKEIKYNIIELEKNNKEVIKYLKLKEELKKTQIDKQKVKLDFINNCPHCIAYMDKTISKDIAKCLSCGKIININDNRINYLSGIENYEKIKELFDDICSFTKDVDNIIALINLELK